MWPDEKLGKTESGCSYHSYKVDLFRILFEIDCDVISIYWTNFYLSRHHVVIHVVIFEIDTFLWGSIPSGEGV